MMSAENITIYTSEADGFVSYLSKIWKYKTLVFTFAKRDLKIKYAQTFFGVLWVLISPFPTVIVFTFLFGKLVNFHSGTLPYPVFALTGMVGWGYFTNLTNTVGVSLIEAQNLLKKIYFPKLILPFAKVLTGGVDFLISFAVIIVVMVGFGITPGWTILFFPIVLLLNIICGFTIGIWIAALTFRYRDLQHLAPNLINFTVWLTPVFYPTTILPPNLAYIMYANPMAMVVSGYRYVLSGGEVPSLHYLVSIIPLFVFFVTGLMYFRKVEDEVIEYI